MARTAVAVTDLRPATASLTTALAGSNNDLTFTARRGGTWGNSISVAYVDPGGTTATLSVTVAGFAITVNLGRASSAINSTAADVTSAIQSSLDASSLVTVANAGSDDGTGLVIALAATSLAGGTWAVTLPALTNGDATNKHYFTGNDGRVILRVVSSDAGTQPVTVNRSPTLGGGVPATAETISVTAGVTREIGPFATSEFNQNSSGDVYFEPSVSNNLDFLAYRVTQAT